MKERGEKNEGKMLRSAGGNNVVAMVRSEEPFSDELWAVSRVKGQREANDASDSTSEG